MVIMDTYYPHDKLLEIWQNIDKLHLSYLEMEESPEKIEHRIKLEDCIRDFLCIAAHNQKFCLRETTQVLHRSASNKKDFSGYKAATGWNAIQLYAGNLLTQSWRKEYRQIKTYCGFYKHQIEANLVGAEIMFEAMGYKHFGDGVLILEGPICPDRVSNVSRDCLIAYVECQILKLIWEELSPNFSISWLDVLEFRKSHLCSPEQSIRALTYQCHQRQYQEHSRNFLHSDPYASKMNQNNIAPVMAVNHSYPSITGHNQLQCMSQPPPQYIYGTNGCCANNYSTYTSSNYCPLPYVQAPMVKAPFNTNGYYCTNGYAPAQNQTVYGCAPVPTGQLIELDHHNGSFVDTVDRAAHSRLHRTTPQTNNDDTKRSDSKANNKEPDKEEVNQFEDWDYVYRNLASQGYSKDLGERGDILKQNKKIKSTAAVDEAIHNLTINERPLKMREALDKYDRDKKKYNAEPPEGGGGGGGGGGKRSQNSSYENLSVNDKKQHKTKTLPREKNTAQCDYTLKSRTFDMKKLNKEKRRDHESWQCKACTYLNENTKDICEMCSKSRVAVEQQMEIGGAECSKCTLVNPKETKDCQVCGASLKDSPTYI